LPDVSRTLSFSDDDDDDDENHFQFDRASDRLFSCSLIIIDRQRFAKQEARSNNNCNGRKTSFRVSG
jgi:hypothetical protein